MVVINFAHMIIGLTGSMGCGKGEIVKILEKEGFLYITLSMMVREEARKRGIEEEREKLMEVGNSMRREEGAGVLARRAVAKILASGHDKWVVDGIRNPAEIDEIKKVTPVEGKDFRSFIIGVETEKELLISRILSRARESDAKTRDEIVRKIDRELGVGEPQDGQQVAKCLQKVDVMIENNGTLEELSSGFLKWYNGVK
jgi:dephospho-CoA kinase